MMTLLACLELQYSVALVAGPAAPGDAGPAGPLLHTSSGPDAAIELLGERACHGSVNTCIALGQLQGVIVELHHLQVKSPSN